MNYEEYGNGVRSDLDYDGRGMISLTKTYRQSNGKTYAKRDYWRDDRDRILGWQKGTDTTANQRENGRGDRYEYDFEGQLTRASYELNDPSGNPTGAVRADWFHYDAMGNRVGWNDVASRGSMLFDRRENKLNQYQSWYNSYPSGPLHWGSAIYHDDDFPTVPLRWTPPGNGVTMAEGWIVASYNALNQPVAIGCNAYGNKYMWFGFDPLGRCVKRWKGSASAGTYGYTPATFFSYDGWNMVQEGATAASAARVYVHGGRVDEIVASQANGTWYNHHYDAQGNCILLSTIYGGIQEQYDYDAFGFPYFYTASGSTPSNVKTRFLFTGREWISDLRIYDYRARLYQPELGRFLQPDSRQFDAGDYNLYRYCHNDPVNKTDPTGMQEIFFMGEVPGVARPQIPPALLDEAIKPNEPKNSIELPDGRRVDLAGRGHGDIETPHVHEPRPAFKPPFDEKFPKPGVERVPRPATPKDIHDAIKHLLERIKRWNLPRIETQKFSARKRKPRYCSQGAW